ncbi:MAG: protein kinase [Planctomycetota bacterium]
MSSNEQPDRARLILALARARGWKIPAGAGVRGDSPASVLGARWDEAAAWERATFEKELARTEEDPARVSVLLGGVEKPGSVQILDPEGAHGTRPVISGAGGPAADSGQLRARYEVRKEHARGGMGRILVVLDREVGREVAMKELLPRFAQGFAWDRERFLREARITGQLEHPNIVPVYEIGAKEGGAAYYTMKLVRGETMEERLERIKLQNLMSPRQRLAERLKLLDAFIDACNAVAYAHSRGVVNRDLKPSNIMIGDFGETVVLDWGLARMRGQEEAPPPRRAPSAPGEAPSKGDTTRLTMDGDIIGTPAYMSPEQARGDIDTVDEKSDVYQLGVMLYELLTGAPPFDDENSMVVLHRVLEETVPPADAVEPLAPRELAAVARAAMTKDRTVRLDSARTLAEEVRAWRDGRPMALYRHTAFEQMRRFARRNRALALSLAGAFLILVAGVAVSLTYARLASNRAVAEHQAREEAVAQADEARRAKQQVQAALGLAQGQRMAAYSLNLLEDNPTAALLVAIEAAHRAPGASSTNALWTACSQLVERRRFLGHAHNVVDGCFSPDGKFIVTAGADFTARIWDVATGAEIRRLEGHRSGLTRAEWGADGRTILTVPGHPDDDRIKPFQPAGTADVAPRLWDAATGKCLHVLKGHRGFLRHANFLPDGRVISFADDSTVRVWEPDGSATVYEGPGTSHRAEVSPDGAWVAAVCSDRFLLWSRADPKRPREFSGHAAGLNSVTFLADSKSLLTCGRDGSVIMRSVESLEIVGRHTLKRPGPNDSGEETARDAHGILKPNGSRFAVHSDLGLHILAPDLSREHSFVKFDGGRLQNRYFDRDWKQVLMFQGVLAQSRDVETGADTVVFRGHEYNVEFAVFSPDGRRVLTGGRDHAAIVWDTAPGACLPTFRWHATQPRAFPSQDGLIAIVQGSDGRLEVHDNGTGEKIAAWDFAGELSHIRFLGDGRRFAAWTPGAKVLWIGDPDRGWLFDADEGGEHHVAFPRSSRNGDWLLLASHENQGRLWNVVTGKGGPAFQMPRRSYDLFSVSDDGQTLAMVDSPNAQVVLYSASELREIGRFVGHTGWTIGSAFVPDGTFLTTAMDASVRAWDTKSGALLRSGRWPLIQETGILLSPAGGVVALDGGGTARFYRLETLDEIAALPRSFSSPVGFTLDGRFATARRSGAIVHLPMDALSFAISVSPRELTPLENQRMSDSRTEAEAYSASYDKRHPRVANLLRRAERWLESGKWEEALRAASGATALLDGHPDAWLTIASAHAAHAALMREGDPARAAAVEDAVKALEEAAGRGYRDVESLEEEAGFAPLRGHERWAALVARAKLAPWDEEAK